MRRVLKIACVVMGVVMLGMTAGVAWARRDGEPLQPAIVQEYRPNGEVRLVQKLRYFEYSHPLTPYLQGNNFDLSPDDNSYFFWGRRNYTPNDPAYANGGYYRVSFDDDEIVGLFPHPTGNFVRNPIYLSSDGEWLWYTELDFSVLRSDIFRIRTDGTQLTNLTKPYTAHFNMPIPPPFVIRKNGEWLFLVAQNSVGNFDLYRIQTSTNTFENLTADIESDVFLEPVLSFPIVVPDAAPVIVTVDNSLYEVLPESGELVPVLETPILPDISRKIEFSEQDLWIVCEDASTCNGIKASTGETLWSVPNPYGSPPGFYASPDQAWIYITHDKLVERMGADGTQREIIATFEEHSFVFLRVGREWMVVSCQLIGGAGYNVGYRQYLMRTDGSDRRHWRDIVLDAHDVVTWRDNERRFAFWDDDPSRFVQYSMREDGSDVRKEIEGIPLLWQPPLDKKWQPALIAFVGFALLIPTLTVTRRRKI